MSRPQFFLIAGPNGAGKSTLTLSIKKRFPSVDILDPDVIAKEMTGSFSNIDQEQLAAGRKAIEGIKKHINEGCPFLVESTISGVSQLNYARMAKQAGFRTVFIYVALSGAKLSAERVVLVVTLFQRSILSVVIPGPWLI